MELKPGYKQTELGVIPDDWDVVTIGELIEKQYILGHLDGNHGELYPRSHEFKSYGVPYVGANDFEEGNVTFSRCKFLSDERAAKFRKGVARDGDVLFAHNATVGPVALLRTNYPVVILSTTATYFRCNTEKLSNSYLKAALQAQYFVSQYQAVMAQSTRFQVPITAQRKLSLVIAPLPEQRAIAQALSDVDTLLTTLDQMIAKKRDLKHAAMQQLLTGKTRLPGFSGEWEVKRLGEIAHIKTGSKNNEDKVEDGQYPFFVRSEFIECINSYSHDCEAILVPGEGRIGDIFHYINGRFDVHQRVYAITKFSPDISGRFVYFYLSKNFGAWAMQNTVKATVDSLRLPTFLTFEMRLPPTLAEQAAIADVLSSIDAELSVLEARRDKTRNLKHAMMQELLTGKTRFI